MRPIDPAYADQIVITIRVGGDFRFPDLAYDGDQVQFRLSGDGWDWNPFELRNAIKHHVLPGRREPFRITDTYTEVEAGASGAFWEMLIELSTGSIKDLAIPILSGYLAGRLGARKKAEMSAVAHEVSDARLEATTMRALKERYGTDQVEGSRITELRWNRDGSASVSCELATGRVFEVGIQFQASGEMEIVSMKRVEAPPLRDDS